jgi:signal transduction histidine kinase
LIKFEPEAIFRIPCVPSSEKEVGNTVKSLLRCMRRGIYNIKMSYGWRSILRRANGRSPAERINIGGFSIALLILAFVGFLSYRATNRLIETDVWADESREAFDKVDALMLEVLEVESSVRGYIIGGKDFYLDPYYEAVGNIDQTLRDLMQMTANRPRLQSRILTMKGLIEDKLAYHKRQINLRSKSKSELANDSLVNGRGHQLMDQIEDVASEVKDEEKALMDRYQKDARAAARQSFYLLTLGIFLSFTIIFLVYYNLQRQISKRKKTESILIHMNRLHLLLSRVGQTIAQVRERDELLKDVCRFAIDSGEFKFAWIGMFDDISRQLLVVQHDGTPDTLPSLIGISIDDGEEQGVQIGRELLQGRHFLCNDTWSVPALKDAGVAYRSFAIFPVQLRDKLIGALCLSSNAPGYFDNETAAILDQLASNLSNALEIIEVEEKRRQAVEQIRKLNEELEQRVAKRTEELIAANTELAQRNQEVEKANRLKSEFLANMSHELRTPLNAIIGFSELLAEEKAGKLQQKQKHFVEHICAGAQHLLKLINEILDISKIEAGRVDLEPESFVAAEALAEVLLIVSPLAVDKRIQIESRLGEDITIFADRIRFKQILYNLLSNAMKFTPEFGRVWIDSFAEADGALRFSVGDTGIGIPKEECKAIFDEFHQVGDAVKFGREGTGLGLAITKRLVELNGGRIWVESEEGQGSTFYFTIPSISAQSSARFGTAFTLQKNSE